MDVCFSGTIPERNPVNLQILLPSPIYSKHYKSSSIDQMLLLQDLDHIMVIIINVIFISYLFYCTLQLKKHDIRISNPVIHKKMKVQRLVRNSLKPGNMVMKQNKANPLCRVYLSSLMKTFSPTLAIHHILCILTRDDCIYILYQMRDLSFCTISQQP